MLPLEGLTVIAVEQAVAAPFCTLTAWRTPAPM